MRGRMHKVGDSFEYQLNQAFYLTLSALPDILFVMETGSARSSFCIDSLCHTTVASIS